MYEDVIARLKYKAGFDSSYDSIYDEAADAIEERDKYALTIQHEMMAEAESHVELVERLNKQIDYLQKQVAYWQAQLTKSMCGETLAELERPRWIPVTERLPEKRKWVLCRCEANIIEVLRWENNEWYHDPMHVYYPSFVTHWMPLPTAPEPPKEET